MRRGWHITRRTRLRLVLLTVLALLCQQVAFAAYVCSPMGMPAASAAMSMHCDGMPMTQPASNTQPSPAMCVYHCAHQPVSTHDAQLPNVPASQLPAIVPTRPFVMALPVAHTAHARAAIQRTPALPPPLRYRVLLI